MSFAGDTARWTASAFGRFCVTLSNMRFPLSLWGGDSFSPFPKNWGLLKDPSSRRSNNLLTSGSAFRFRINMLDLFGIRSAKINTV